MPSESSDNRRPTTTVNNHRGAPEPEHLPCPRCTSTNTKFCYYNNYNFSQPRHFCKSCRRYWTHGGALRDIPVGGASRKNAKRSRHVSTPVSSAGLEYRHLLPSPTTPAFIPFGGVNVHGGGSFMSLLSSTHNNGLFGTEVCGFDQDGSFGVGRTMWPFSGGVVGGHSVGGGGGWQLEGGDCFVLPDLAISTPGNAMK